MKIYRIFRDGVQTNEGKFEDGTEWLSQFSGDFSLVIEDVSPPSYSDLRKVEYSKRIDPFLAEAITDKEAGDSTKMNQLLAEKTLIKQEIPKPE